MKYLLPLAVFFALITLSSPVPAADKLPVSSICIDAKTGETLAADHETVKRPPASVIKLIQMLLVCEGIEAKQWGLDTKITATRNAQRMGGTQVYLAEGDIFSLGHLMKAVAVASANDAAMAVAEGLWGSEEAYLKAVNKRVQALGMADTVFHSVHGLPPDRGEAPDQTTAKDIAILARACVQHPQILAWTSMKEFQFREEGGLFHSTNKLLWRMENCDGLKTGFIRAAGFCIAATAERDGTRLISVVLGHDSKYGRFNLAEQLMDEAFEALAKTDVAQKPEGALLTEVDHN